MPRASQIGSLGLTSETTPTSAAIITGASGETRKMTFLTSGSWTYGVHQHAPAALVDEVTNGQWGSFREWAYGDAILNEKTVSHPTRTIADVAFSIDATGFDDDGM